MIAELAILRMKQLDPRGICVYIAPLKSLARERLNEWKKRFGGGELRWKVLELSGDTSHDVGVLERADILVCTPEKWDLISRGWLQPSGTKASNGKAFIKRVKLLAIDEIHLLGESRGAVLEAIVSRTRFISRYLRNEQGNEDGSATGSAESTRIIGLSTALANPWDLASWMGIDIDTAGPERSRGLYNFPSTVRAVPLDIHVQGYSGRHYVSDLAWNCACFFPWNLSLLHSVLV